MTDEQNLIKEVNEEVRQDNYKRIWNKYKKYIISLIVIVLVIVSAININNYSKEKLDKLIKEALVASPANLSVI